MGKKSKIKQRQAEEAEAQFKQNFAELSKAAATPPAARPLVDSFEAYSVHFVRPPEAFVLRTRSQHRDKQLREMARHLFGRFRVPKVLDQVWGSYEFYKPEERLLPLLPRYARVPGARYENPTPAPARRHLDNPNLDIVDFRAWYVCVATGGSLYKDHAKGFLTKREVHFFLTCPSALDLCQAVVYAVARAAGAACGLAQRLARSKLSQQRFGEFWFGVVRFFCQPDNSPATVDSVNDLVDYLDHRLREDPGFRLLGTSQSLAALSRRMEQWHRALARARDLSGIQWPGVALPDIDIKTRDPNRKDSRLVWRFTQITSGKVLAAEGTAMRHCVFSYKTSCVRGDCSIWSLTCEDEAGTNKARRLTIEVDKFGNVVQKRGLANRQPRPDEASVVDSWAKQMGFNNRQRW